MSMKKRMIVNLALCIIFTGILLGIVNSQSNEAKALANASTTEQTIDIEDTDTTNSHEFRLTAGASSILPLEIKKIQEEEKYLKSMRQARIERNDVQPTTSSFTYDEVGWATSNVNVRQYPSTDSKVLGIIQWNEKIEYMTYDADPDWVGVKYNDTYAYVSSKYISDTKISSKRYSVSGDIRKSYMDWRKITDISSRQYKLQQSIGSDSENGVRVANGRYCIAVGKFYTTEVGQYVDVVLENGTVIPAIIGDCKKPIDTKNNYKIGIDGGVAEFVVAENKLTSEVRLHGDVSYVSPSWKSNVVEMIFYDYIASY